MNLTSSSKDVAVASRCRAKWPWVYDNGVFTSEWTSTIWTILAPLFQHVVAVALPLHRPSPSITVPVALPTCRRVAIVAAAIAVAIAATSTAHFCWSLHWLVVALLSAVSFCHRMPSCDSRRSCCRPLLPPILVHRRHHCHRRSCRCHCRRAATIATATTTTLKLGRKTLEVGYSVGNFWPKNLVSGEFWSRHPHAKIPKFINILTCCRHVANMSPIFPAKATGRRQLLVQYCIISNHISFFGSKKEGIH